MSEGADKAGVIGNVYGRVQGVGFRYFVRKNAKAHNVQGWAKNQQDGSVEVCLVGEEDALLHLQKVVESGPVSANVTSVSWQPIHEGLDHIVGFLAH